MFDHVYLSHSHIGMSPKFDIFMSNQKTGKLCKRDPFDQICADVPL